MSFLEIDHVSKTYGEGPQATLALEQVTVKADLGEFICLLGVSGCGKSTLLQLIAGLEIPSAGQLRIAGTAIDGRTHPSASVVFQDHGLFPWMDVKRNVAFSLKARGVGPTERAKIARDFIELVGLAAFADKYPHQLSGGMRQRVGIARALSTNPKLLLMDEPFGALDAQTRTVMQAELLRLWGLLKTTIIFVTHSIEEAVMLADRVVVMSPRPGRVRQTFAIDLARPRDPSDPRFINVAREMLLAIHDDMRLMNPA